MQKAQVNLKPSWTKVGVTMEQNKRSSPLHCYDWVNTLKHTKAATTHLSGIAGCGRLGVDALEWLHDLCATHVSIHCFLEAARFL